MKFTISQISQLLEGEIEGDDTIEIRNVARIEEAKKGDIAFIFDPKYEKCIYDTQASAYNFKDLALIILLMLL